MHDLDTIKRLNNEAAAKVLVRWDSDNGRLVYSDTFQPATHNHYDSQAEAKADAVRFGLTLE